MTTPRPQLAVGAVVLNDDELLMVKRARDPGRGLWTIPGGRVESGESLAAAVAREVREETGLEIVVGDLLGVFEVLGDPHLVVLDYLATAPRPHEAAAGDDAEEVRWVPLTEIESLPCTPRFAETLRGWNLLPPVS